MSESAVRVVFRPTADDYLAIFREQVWASRPYQVARIASAALALVLVATAIVRPERTDAAIGAAFGMLAVLSLWIAGPALIRRGIAQRYGSGSAAEVEYRVDERGVHGKSAWAAWDDVVQVKETPEAFVVWMRPGAGAYLPKRAMADAEVVRLRALFETHAGGRARLGAD